jgi:hypothetical protein
VASAITFPHLKLVKRFGVAMGFVVMGILPRAILRAHFATIASPQKRHNAAAGADCQGADS